MTDKQRLIAKELERLVHHRTNETELNEQLSKLFGKEIVVEDLTESNEDWTGDWYFAFNVEDAGELSGFFDIYYLKMRENDDNLDFYITEVAYEFCEY